MIRVVERCGRHCEETIGEEGRFGRDNPDGLNRVAFICIGSAVIPTYVCVNQPVSLTCFFSPTLHDLQNAEIRALRTVADDIIKKALNKVLNTENQPDEGDVSEEGVEEENCPRVPRRRSPDSGQVDSSAVQPPLVAD
jgi:hypothetical protein